MGMTRQSYWRAIQQIVIIGMMLLLVLSLETLIASVRVGWSESRALKAAEKAAAAAATQESIEKEREELANMTNRDVHYDKKADQNAFSDYILENTSNPISGHGYKLVAWVFKVYKLKWNDATKLEFTRSLPGVVIGLIVLLIAFYRYLKLSDGVIRDKVEKGVSPKKIDGKDNTAVLDLGTVYSRQAFAFTIILIVAMFVGTLLGMVLFFTLLAMAGEIAVVTVSYVNDGGKVFVPREKRDEKPNPFWTMVKRTFRIGKKKEREKRRTEKSNTKSRERLSTGEFTR